MYQAVLVGEWEALGVFQHRTERSDTPTQGSPGDCLRESRDKRRVEVKSEQTLASFIRGRENDRHSMEGIPSRSCLGRQSGSWKLSGGRGTGQ